LLWINSYHRCGINSNRCDINNSNNRGVVALLTTLTLTHHAPWWPNFQPWSPQNKTTVASHSPKEKVDSRRMRRKKKNVTSSPVLTHSQAAQTDYNTTTDSDTIRI